MATYTLRFDMTERTVQEIDIEANSLDEAKRLVREYEFDNGHAWQIDCLEWSVDNVRTRAEEV